MRAAIARDRRRARVAALGLRLGAVGGWLMLAGAAAWLAPAPSRADTISLTWTAPGDDGTAGRGSAYELRFSEQPLSGTDTTSWWNGASTAGILPPPAAAGTRESYVLSGLATGSTYYFVLRTADEAGNWSAYSNVRVRQVGTAGGALATPESFTATVVAGGVDLSWSEPVSGSGSGYHLYRRAGASGMDSLLATITVGYTTWRDASAAGGVSYEYRLATFQGSGEGMPAVAAVSIPTDRLTRASRGIRPYPNPARGKVTLRFPGGTEQGEPARVRLVIYDLTGHKVCELVDRVLPAGEQAIEWSLCSDHGNRVAPGLYNAILDGPRGRTITRIAVVP